jgi:hypothetical protein
VLNVVLFHKAARVEAIELPKGTEIEASSGRMCEEGWETEYVVIEQVPPNPEAKKDNDQVWPDFATSMGTPWMSPDPDYREATLRIDMESIKVHVVQRVEFDTLEYDVHRRRWEKRESDF